MTKNIIYKPRKERKDKLGEYLQSLDNKQKQSKFNIQQINIKSKSEFLHLNQEDTSASQISSEVSENEIYSMKDILTTKSNKSENNTSWKPKRSRFTRLMKYLKERKKLEENISKSSKLDRDSLSSHQDTN